MVVFKQLVLSFREHPPRSVFVGRVCFFSEAAVLTMNSTAKEYLGYFEILKTVFSVTPL